MYCEMDSAEESNMRAPKGFSVSFGASLLLTLTKMKGECIMLYRHIAVFIILIIGLAANLSLTQSIWAETLDQSIVETRLLLGMRVAEPELQKMLPSPWQVSPIPGGPLKGGNLFISFIDSCLVQDPQGKPLMGGISRILVFPVSAKNAQTGEVAIVAVGGFTSDIRNVPGPYKNYVQANIRREQSQRWVSVEAGDGDDFWEVKNTRGETIEVRLQYQRGLPSRSKGEQRIYSAVEPSFYRIYRLESAGDIIKSAPAGIDRVQNYRFQVNIPEFKNLFDGTEQLLGIIAYPLYLRQVFLP